MRWAPSASPEQARARAWRFHPLGDPGFVRDEVRRFATRLEATVRAAHGLEAELRLRVLGGRYPSVQLEADGRAAEHWLLRLLAIAYEPGEWSRARPYLRPPRAIGLRGRRRALPGESGLPPGDLASVLRTLVVGFSGVSKGTALECRLRPLPCPTTGVGRPGGGTAPWRTVPAATPRGRDRWSEHPLAGIGPRPAPDVGLLWSVVATLVVPPSTDGAIERRAVGAAEAAWRQLDGVGVRFGRGLGARWFPSSFLVSDLELLALLPYRDLPIAGEEPPAGAAGAVALGRDLLGGIVALPLEPHQGRHVAIVGETGMGKSSLLIGLARRAAAVGTVIVLDPLGEAARAIREEVALPPERILFLGAADEVPSLNALEGIGPSDGADPVRAERRIGDIVHALRRVRAGRYAAGPYWGPRIEEMLTRAVEVAAGFPGGTLEDAHTVLATAGHTRRVAPPAVRVRLGELADRIRERPEDADGARRLLQEVVRNPTLRTALCDPAPKLSLHDLIAPDRVVLIAGDAARVGETTARYLLAVDLALLWSELLAREERGKVFLILDEAQWYAHDSLAEMLKLARRTNVHVVLATQALGSLPEEVREAAWTNVADFVAFRGSPEGARELASLARGVPAAALTSLPRGTALTLLGKGRDVRWIRTVRLPAREDYVPADPYRPPADGSSERDELRDRERSGPYAAIVALARRQPPGALLRVALADLGGARDPSGRELRSLGSHLGRLGALVRTERGPGGNAWWIDPARLVPAGPRTGPPAPAHDELPPPSTGPRVRDAG